MEKLFINETLVRADLSTVKAKLLKIDQLMRWNPSISIVKIVSNNTFIIQRNDKAINNSEIILIEEDNTQIKFHSTQGNLEYDLIFELKSMGKSTEIIEKFNITNDIQFPIGLLKFFTKQAFNKNLNTFKRLVEL